MIPLYHIFLSYMLKQGPTDEGEKSLQFVMENMIKNIFISFAENNKKLNGPVTE